MKVSHVSLLKPLVTCVRSILKPSGITLKTLPQLKSSRIQRLFWSLQVIWKQSSIISFNLLPKLSKFCPSFVLILYSKQGYVSKNWVEGISVEVYYLWEPPKNFWIKSVNPTLGTEQKNVLIYLLKLTCKFFQTIENKWKLILFLIFLPC